VPVEVSDREDRQAAARPFSRHHANRRRSWQAYRAWVCPDYARGTRQRWAAPVSSRPASTAIGGWEWSWLPSRRS